MLERELEHAGHGEREHPQPGGALESWPAEDPAVRDHDRAGDERGHPAADRIDEPDEEIHDRVLEERRPRRDTGVEDERGQHDPHAHETPREYPTELGAAGP